ncbi:MAG: glycosyltransferase [Idiomarinaceae bacterium]|nr:glycosyltransferase [Idiomarinaceae bacterium]|tara:strand:- start:11554 stop:12282 length:729 start_codon:yes stop_codon:yes gene_type:complete
MFLTIKINNYDEAMSEQELTLETSSRFQLRHLTVGHTFEIEFESASRPRIKLPLVGCEHGRYLIVRSPNPKTHGSYADVMYDGCPIIVRTVVEGDKGEIIAFKSNILAIINYPVRLMFLAYPESIENRNLRATQRFPTRVPITLSSQHHDQLAANGVMVDVSMSGCRLLFNVSDKQTALKEQAINLHLHYSQGNSEPILRGDVKNQRKTGQELAVGVAFTDDEAFVKQQLKRYLMIDLDLAV